MNIDDRPTRSGDGADGSAPDGWAPDGWAPDGSGGPHCFVDDLDAPALSPEDRHHLERVVRVRAGDALTVSDGAGRWRACRMGDPLVVDGPVVSVARPAPSITVGFALVKGAKPELVVQKLTEVGVDRIVPFAADRSVVRWDADRARHYHRRLESVARAAAMQCRRVWPAVIDPVSTFADLVAGSGPNLRLADMGGLAPALGSSALGSSALGSSGPVDDLVDGLVVLVGPEGGWSPAERNAVAASMRFGPHVLRAETAAIVVGATLVALREGFVRPAV